MRKNRASLISKRFALGDWLKALILNDIEGQYRKEIIGMSRG